MGASVTFTLNNIKMQKSFGIYELKCTNLDSYIACIQRDVQKMCQTKMFMPSQYRGTKTHEAIYFPLFFAW